MAISAKRRLDNHTTGLDLTCHSVPEGMDLFKIEKEGAVRLEIIPYRVPEGANNPFADPGNYWYERTYYNHPRIGVNGDSYICLAKTYGKPCPVCEERQRIARDEEASEATEKLVKSLQPKERQLWYVYDHAAPEKGVQLWEVSHHIFGKILDTQARSADPGDNWDLFADPDEGFTVKASFAEERFGDIKFFKCSVVDFKRREEGAAKVIKGLMAGLTTPLDSLLKPMQYSRLKAIFMQTDVAEEDGDDDDTPTPAPAKTEKPKAKEKAEENAHSGETYKPEPKKPRAEKPAPSGDGDAVAWVKGETVQHPKHGECTVFKVNDDGTATLMDNDDTPIKNVPPLKAAKSETKGPELKAGDALFFGDADDSDAPKGHARVHKISGDTVVVTNDDDDIAKVSMAVAQTARVAAMTIGMNSEKKLKNDKSDEEPAEPKPKAKAEKPAAKKEEKADEPKEESWDEDWD